MHNQDHIFLSPKKTLSQSAKASDIMLSDSEASRLFSAYEDEIAAKS